MKPKRRLKDMNPVELSIFRREGAISRMKQNIQRIRERANEEIAEIESRIKEKSFLLEALKRGAIKP